MRVSTVWVAGCVLLALACGAEAGGSGETDAWSGEVPAGEGVSGEVPYGGLDDGPKPDVPTVWLDQGPEAEARQVQDFTGWEAPTLEMPTVASLPPGLELMVAKSCDEVTGPWRQALLQQLHQEMMANWSQLTHPRYCPPVSDPGGYWDLTTAVDTVAPSDSGSGADSYSQTNTQEVGVDEADFLKNDGKYLYILADGRFQVLEAWPPEGLKRLSATPIPGVPREMFVQDGVAVIYSSEGLDSAAWNQGKCTYGYDCDFTGDGGRLVVTVLDLADVSHPVLTRQVRASGSYLNSRRVGRYVYTVVYFGDPGQGAQHLEALPSELYRYLNRCDDVMLPYTEDQMAQMFVDLWKAQVAAVQAAGLPLWMPQVTDTWYQAGQPSVQASPLGDCNGYLVSGSGDGRDLISVLSFDLKEKSALKATTIRSRPGAIYATRQSMYLAVRHEAAWGTYDVEPPGGGEATSLHKFFLADEAPTTQYVATGKVKGRGLNQFSLDEHDGYLRIATTSGHLPGPAYNTVTVLQEQEGALVQVGQLDNLAPNEDIRSVRFGEDVGFIVTFKKTDPLFAIDLKDPTKPAVLGELKIPGFSTYLHFLDPTHLLSIGYDAQDQGGFAWFAGIQLQMFDVTSLLEPKLMHKLVIGTRGSASDAATNHLAFNLFNGYLALPMTVCEGGDGGSFGQQMTFNGLKVFKVSLETGFEDLGGIEHALPESWEYGGYSQECSQWWSSATTSVKRSVFMDDYVFSVATDLVKTSKLADVPHPVAQASLVAP